MTDRNIKPGDVLKGHKHDLLVAGLAFSLFCFDCYVLNRMKDHQINPISLRFMDIKLEEHYSSEKEKRSGAAFSCCIIVLFFITAMEVFIDPL